MEPISIEELFRTCAIQAVRNEKQMEEIARLKAANEGLQQSFTAAGAEIAKLEASLDLIAPKQRYSDS